jgi:hypothetical protein
VALVLALAFGACARAAPPATRALVELERLAFVPPAACFLLPDADLSVGTALVFDRFELTRADLAHLWPARARRARELAWREEAAADAAERGQWPAFVDFHEAVELARLRGMRLPTPVEWLHVAVGRRDYAKPWGGPGREYFANTIVRQDGQDFSLRSPCAVGTFENGRSRPFGCYDLLGNVWEWVDGVVLGSAAEGDEVDDALGSKASVLGGAYDSPWRATFELDRRLNRQRFHALTLDKRTLGPAFGVRMCAEAEGYLWGAASRWGEGAAVRARVQVVGARWARDDALARAALKALLSELGARPGAPHQLAWLEEGVLTEP